MINRKLSYILSLVLLLTGCQKEEPAVVAIDGPKFLSSTPADGAEDIEGTVLTITLTFDQNIRCSSSQTGLITIDNGAVIDRISLNADEMTIGLSGLKGGKTYTLNIPEGVIQGQKLNQKRADEIKLTFSTRYEKPYVPSDPESIRPLVNPNATKEASNVYAFLQEQRGKKTLSGVQSGHSYKNDFIDAVYEHTGKHPALAGYDFLFIQFSPTPDNWDWVRDYNDISAQKEHWSANGLVNYMWHWNVPDSKADWDNGVMNYNFDGYAFYSSDTSFDINEALKEGTWQNDFIMKDIKEVAGYLQLLEDAGIPVIWRPLHEAAGNYDLYGPDGAWFWWGRGGAEPCKALWRLLYDQLVNVYGLDNLIWVWTVDVVQGAEDQFLDWYPGDEYVDVLGVDIYAPDTEAKTRQYQALASLSEVGKPVTVSECGNIPDPSKCMAAGNQWSWFMVWPNTDQSGNIDLTPSDKNFKLNTPDYWKQVMSDPYIITREDMPSLK